MEETHMKIPQWLNPGLKGAAVGAVALAAVGFSFGGWVTGKTAEDRVATARQETMVAALAPICAQKFQLAAKADNGLIVELKAVESWQRDGYLKKAGWATFPGGAEPNDTVAEACATLLSATLK